MAVVENLATIARGTYREVNPISGASLLLDQLIKIPFSPVGDIEQDACHADHLPEAVALNIHRAARQVIRALRAPTLQIHLLTPRIPLQSYNIFHLEICLLMPFGAFRCLSMPLYLEKSKYEKSEVVKRAGGTLSYTDMG